MRGRTEGQYGGQRRPTRSPDNADSPLCFLVHVDLSKCALPLPSKRLAAVCYATGRSVATVTSAMDRCVSHRSDTESRGVTNRRKLGECADAGVESRSCRVVFNSNAPGLLSHTGRHGCGSYL